MHSLTLSSNLIYRLLSLSLSGTIFVRGFIEGIGQNGIAGEPSSAGHKVKLPMKERVAILSRLGQGASSIVYKALDISEMTIVALKAISVYDRDKRRQMVRELSALYAMIRQKQTGHNLTIIIVMCVF